MNLTQKIITTIALIIMGSWTLFFSYFLASEGYADDVLSFFMSLLGFAFIVAALLVLFHSKKKR